MGDLNSKIDRLQRELRALSQEVQKDEDARKQLMAVVMEGMATVEAPLETLWRMIMTVKHDTC